MHFSATMDTLAPVNVFVNLGTEVQNVNSVQMRKLLEQTAPTVSSEHYVELYYFHRRNMT